MSFTSDSELRYELTPISKVRHSELGTLFSSVVATTPFQSISWFLPWLDVLPADADIYKISLFIDGKPIVFAFVGLCSVRRRLFFKRRIIYLNEYPVEGYDFVIEHNDILSAETIAERSSVWSGLVGFLQNALSWGEICIRLTPECNVDALFFAAAANDLVIENERCSSDVFADFSQYGQWSDVEAALFSSNKRSQIRRARKAYIEKYNVLSVAVASSLEQALAWFDNLGELHTRTWNKRSLPGVFADKAWVRFHQKVIEREFKAGNVQLLKVEAGELGVGYLYNLLCDDRVYNIQSGFYYENDNKFKPGILSHYLALQHNYLAGCSEYHFLAGGESYKQSLSNREIPLWDLRLQKKSFSMVLEKYIVCLVRKIKRLLASR